MESLVENAWQSGKLLIKALIIGVLVLLLMVPTYFVKGMILEREERHKEAFAEVSSKWSGLQNLLGPVIVLPYRDVITDEKNRLVELRRLAYLLPEKLDIKSTVRPEKRHRGIYEVMLYTSVIEISGKFPEIPYAKLKLLPTDILWSEAYVFMGISDPRGLKEELKLRWQDSTLTLNPEMVNNGLLREAFTSPLDSGLANSTAIDFSGTISLNGSEQLLFTPVGRETNVQMNSTWPDPSFTGSQLPETTDIADSGFSAKWKSYSHKRNFPQAWKDQSYDMSTAAFGADLYIPVTGYQKTLRSVKYSILCILLTFAAFFIIETVNRKAVHPFQYALVGLALILFYTLLLSFSEYIGFNAAYVVAAVATIGLIAWFVKSLLGSVKLSGLLSIILVLMYGYIFTILQLQDYALLLGSIGLFITLAMVMNFSRKIKW